MAPTQRLSASILLMEHMGIQAYLYQSAPMHEVKPVPVPARIFLRPRVKDQPPPEGCRRELLYANATRAWLDDVAGAAHLVQVDLDSRATVVASKRQCGVLARGCDPMGWKRTAVQRRELSG